MGVLQDWVFAYNFAAMYRLDLRFGRNTGIQIWEEVERQDDQLHHGISYGVLKQYEG